MSWFGKIIGGAIGFAIGGPAGLVVGAGLGHVADEKIEGDNKNAIQTKNEISSKAANDKRNNEKIGEQHNVITKGFETKVVGVTYEDRQQTIANLSESDTIYLRREPNNTFDCKAIAVVTSTNKMIGYISKEQAAILAPVMDQGKKFNARIVKILGGGSLSLGVLIAISPSNSSDSNTAIKPRSSDNCLQGHSKIINDAGYCALTPNNYISKVYCISNENRERLLANISNEEVYLQLIPDKYNSNFIGVFTSKNNSQIGWLPPELSKILAPFMGDGNYYRPTLIERQEGNSELERELLLDIIQEKYEYVTKLDRGVLPDIIDNEHSSYILNQQEIEQELQPLGKNPEYIDGYDKESFDRVGEDENMLDNRGKYEGDFWGGFPNGQGTETLRNGEKYVGTWNNGKRDGQGILTWSDGEIYVGQFENGQRKVSVHHGNNIVNNGFVAQQKDWVYFSNPSDNNHLYKIKTEGGELTCLNMDKSQSISIVNDWVYYSNLSDGRTIYRILTDGSRRTCINRDESWFINVVDDWIYYSNWSDGKSLYRIRTDGSERTQLNHDESWFINVADNWVYYINENDHKTIYKIRTDGSERTQLNYDDSSLINIFDGWVYYKNRDCNDHIYKIRTDGSEGTCIETSGPLNVSLTVSASINVVGDWLYYCDNSNRIRKFPLKGTKRGFSDLCQDKTWRINVVDGWVYYIDDSKKLNKIRTDGTGHSVVQ